MTPEEYMNRPYTYCLVYDSESKTWTGKIKEFPGCIAQGDGWEIIFMLRRAALDWIAAALELGQEIPEPVERAGGNLDSRG
jgi:predicted RNase H-like HicB family nuclease